MKLLQRRYRFHALSGTLALLVCAMSTTATAQAPLVKDGSRVQIVIDAVDSLSDSDVKALGASAGVSLTLNSIHSDDANLYVAWVEADEVEAVLSAIGKAEGVESAETNFLMSIPDLKPVSTKSDASAEASPQGKPNDPLYQYQWHFDQIDVEGAWRKTTGKGAVVAVIDTGVAYKDKGDNFTQTPDLKNTKFVGGSRTAGPARQIRTRFW